jgi:formate-dependent nitrite reductase membrane component NrfD
MVGLLVVVDALYFLCWLPLVPLDALWVLRVLLAAVALLLGFGVLLYTGIELASMKARVFWNTPALPLVFALGGLLSGCAADYLVVALLPQGLSASLSVAGAAMAGGVGEAAGATAVGGVVTLTLVTTALRVCMAVLCVATLISLLLYVLMMYATSSPGARDVALRWLNGRYALPFWGGLLLIGLLLPLALLALDTAMFAALAAVLAVVGEVFLRFLVVYSDDRRMIDAEAAFWERLPRGDEAFLDKHWG